MTDPNFDIVPTLRMFDGVMMNQAADEIERLRALLAQRAAPVATVSDTQIREIFMRNGFTIKEGQTDLKPYVYAAARDLLAQRAGTGGDARDAARYRWLRGPDHESTRYSRWRIEYWGGPNGWQPVQRESMDIAIDAAMEAAKS